MSDILKTEILLKQDKSRVWEAISEPSVMKQWYFDVPAFRPVIGTKFTFPGGPPNKEPYNHLCEVTEVEELQRLSYSWCYEGYPGYSEVVFELVEQGEGCRLTLIHRGLESFPIDNPDFKRENFEAGWAHIIGTALPEFLDGQ